ncbi:MAG: alpha/beta fold hydrolase [Planctomycetes bacterium]|nr:alpha/beta fold hydrolase [Planctomycetota bacterium]
MLLVPSYVAAAAPSTWRQRQRELGVAKTVAVGPLEVHYLERGSGPAIVFLHGYGGSAFDWRHQLEPFAAAGFRALALDLKGAGYTSRPPDGRYAVEDQVELVLGFLEALGIQRAHFVGNSYGGGITLALALLHPERADKLVLLDSMSYRQRFPLFVATMLHPVLARLSAALVPDALQVRYVLHLGYCEPRKIPREVVREYVHDLRIPGNREALGWMARQLLPADIEERERAIATVRKPTLILWGDHDRIIPIANGERLHRDIRGSRYVVLEKCGHMPNQEKPEVVNPLIVEFLRGDGL